MGHWEVRDRCSNFLSLSILGFSQWLLLPQTRSLGSLSREDRGVWTGIGGIPCNADWELLFGWMLPSNHSPCPLLPINVTVYTEVVFFGMVFLAKAFRPALSKMWDRPNMLSDSSSPPLIPFLLYLQVLLLISEASPAAWAQLYRGNNTTINLLL